MSDETLIPPMDHDPAATEARRGTALLDVRDLVCRYSTPRGQFTAVNEISFDVLPGETLGIVGESGCGKTTTGRALVQLPSQTSGSINFDGKELSTLSRHGLRDTRRDLQMVFQDPVAAFNPRRRVADLVSEGLRIAGVSGAEVRRRVDEALTQVGLDPDQVRDRRPTQLSGGQNQRVAIARALALRPKLMVLDEPVASLDVSVQAQVLNVLRDIKRSTSLSMIFISHDLSIVKYVSDRVAVMYAGRIVEIGEAQQVFDSPRHPYTQKLLEAIPVPVPKGMA